MEKINLLSIPLSTGFYKEFITTIVEYAATKRSYYACVANVHTLIEAHHNEGFASIINNADIITPDGKPLSWGLRLLYGIKQDRVAGMDLLPDLLASAADKLIPVYFYGGTYRMMQKTSTYLKKNYPSLKIAGLNNPPFRQLTSSEDQHIIKKINNSGAGIVFVALGCPKQEKWMASMKGKINAVTVGIGGALPVMIGMQKRAPMWMQKNGLEWTYRLVQEPQRLFKRYAVTNTKFIYLLLRNYLHLKKYKGNVAPRA